MSGTPKIGRHQFALWIVGGIVGPILCLTVESLWHPCRDGLFDPIPTPWHQLLILTVPTATLLGLRALERPERRTRVLGVLLGCAACTSLVYAVPFIPLFPMSLCFLIAYGIGLLGLAPIVAPIAVLSLAAEFRIRAGDPGGTKVPWAWTGFFGCLLLVGWITFG